MGKMKDLTGQKFGLLYVEGRAENVKPGRPAWICRCDCGNITTVSSTALTKTGGTKSCGCLRRKASPTLVDITGQKFGLLTVMRKDITTESGKAKWICQCDCGNTVSVLSSSTL